MTLTEIDAYEVMLRNGEEKCIIADEREHTDDDLFFFKEHIVVAWFNPRDIVGYRKVKEYGWTNDDVAVKENENE